MSRFSCDFTGEVPEGVEIGDLLHVQGVFTVRGILGDMVETTSCGGPERWVVGGSNLELLANDVRVERAASAALPKAGVA